MELVVLSGRRLVAFVFRLVCFVVYNTNCQGGEVFCGIFSHAILNELTMFFFSKLTLYNNTRHVQDNRKKQSHLKCNLSAVFFVCVLPRNLILARKIARSAILANFKRKLRKQSFLSQSLNCCF